LGIIRCPSRRTRPWVEIRREPGIGTGIWASRDSEDGHIDAWHELVASVRKGETIYHYSARESRFVGRSVAAADAVDDDDEGAYTVELEHFTQLRSVLGLDELRTMTADIYAVRDELAEQHDPPLYLPFQFRSDGLRFVSDYFAKLPARLVAELFGADGLGRVDEQVLEAPIDHDSKDSVSTGTTPGPNLGYLSPFKPKADTDYVVNIRGVRRTQTRKHETLVNLCAKWLADRGLEPARNVAVEPGLDDPPVIIEAEIVASSWASSIREAVGQLYEYRFFQVVDADAGLIFLSSEKVPDRWVDCLENDRRIGSMWPASTGFDMTALAARFLS
jgi:hypothetical protein